MPLTGVPTDLQDFVVMRFDLADSVTRCLLPAGYPVSQ